MRGMYVRDGFEDVAFNGRRVTSLGYGLGFDLSDVGDAVMDVVDAAIDAVAYFGKHLDSVAEIAIVAGLVMATGGGVLLAKGAVGAATLIAVGGALSSAGYAIDRLEKQYGPQIKAAIDWAQTGTHSATDALRKAMHDMPPKEQADLIASQDYRIAINLLNDYGAHPERTAGMPEPTFRDPDVDVAAILKKVSANELTGREAYEAFANSGRMAESAIERAKWENSLRYSPIGALILAGIAENSKSAVVMLGTARDLENAAAAHPSNESELLGLAKTLRERAKQTARAAAGAGVASAGVASTSGKKKLVVGTVVAGGAAAGGLAWYASKHGLTMMQALRRIFGH